MSDILLQQADGYLVTYAKGGLRQWDLRDDLKEARDAYSYPPKDGWKSIGISACKDGVPFAALNVPVIQFISPRSAVSA